MAWNRGENSREGTKPQRLVRSNNATCRSRPRLLGSRRWFGASPQLLGSGSRLLGVLVVIAVVGAVVWWFYLRDRSDEDVASPAVSPTERTAVGKRPTGRLNEKPTAKPKSVPKRQKPSFMEEKPRSEWTSREVAIAYQWYAADTNNAYVGISMADRIPPPTFSNIVQECLAPYLIPGADVVPMGPISDREAREAVATEIVIGDDDSDEIAEKKRGVKTIMDELKAFMDEGGHAVDYFLKLEARQALESETMEEIRNNVRELERGGDTELARETLEKYNRYLDGKGLPRIHMIIREKKGNNQ